MGDMLAHNEQLLSELRRIVSNGGDRTVSLQQIADILKNGGIYRWVGLYDVDHANGQVSIIVWSGQGAPEHPTFPLTKGLTSAAVSGRKTINVGDITADPRYLTAFGTTRSEIIVSFRQACMNSAEAVGIVGCPLYRGRRMADENQDS